MSTQDYENMKLQKSAEVTEVLESRHILDDEVKMVIANAESTGEKLYQPKSDRFLAKKRVGTASDELLGEAITYYVEYSVAEENTYVIYTAYSHRTKLMEK
jgi:hypothetical protein